jgi:hypothetical protein
MPKLRTEPEQQAYERRMELLYEQLRTKGDPFEREGASNQNSTCCALIGLILHGANGSRRVAHTPVPQVIVWLRKD